MTLSGPRGSWGRQVLVLGAAFIGCVGFSFLLWTQALGGAGSKAVDDFGQAAVDLVAAWACLSTARRSAGRLGRGWGLLAAAATAFATGELSQAVSDQHWYQGGMVAVMAYFFFVSTIPLGFVGAGFVLFPFQRPATLLRFVLDSLLITTSLLYVSVVLVLDNLNATGGPRGLQLAVFLIYSAGDVAVCSIALLGLSRAPVAMRPVGVALLAAFLFIAVGDGFQASGNLYSTGSPIDTLYLAGMALVIVAANLRRPELVAPPQTDDEDGWQSAIPYLPPILALVVAAISYSRGVPLPPLQRIAGFAVVATALAALVTHRVDLARMLRRSRTTESALARNQLLLDRLLDTAPAALFSFDERGKVQLFRGHPLAFADRDLSVEGRDVRDLLGRSPEAVQMVDRSLKGETGQVALTVDSGELEMLCTPVLGENRQVQSVTGIVLDVTAQRRLQREIAENAAKSQLLATVSHELRTPLNSILGFAQLIDTASAGPLTDKQRRYIGHVQTSGRHLLRLINGILDFSKLAAGGELDVEVTTVDPRDVIASAVEEVRPLAGERVLEASTGPELGAIRADPVRLEQILLNLLANAVQWTAATGHIVVSCRHLPGRLEISVADDGPGIPSGDLERIFGRYQQSSRNRARQSGTGLGLPVSRHLAQKMSGSLTADSGRGKGTTFRLCLPLADAG